MEKSPKGYIEEKIKSTRTKISDERTKSNLQHYNMSEAQFALMAAALGNPYQTASSLYLDKTLSVHRKGEILTLAFTQEAKHFESLTEDLGAHEARALAEKSQINAQLLRRITKRTQNS